MPVARDPAGIFGPTPAETRGSSWRRSSWGRYVEASVELTPEQRILEAAVLAPTHGGVTGWAGLKWIGAHRWFEGYAGDGQTPRPVVLAIGGENVRSQAGILVSEERLDPRDLVVVDGITVTTAVRSTCYEMRYAVDERQAALVLSMAAYHDMVTIEELAEYATRHNGWTGIPQCRKAIPFAEENCWSPTEFEMVWTWRVIAELPQPLCNQPLFDRSGHHIGTPDLLDVEAGVVGQYHGRHHLAEAQQSVDARAEELYRDFGLECFTLFASDRGNTARVVERMHAARSRARWEAESRRRWTIEYPSWWIPTHTVELRRALTVDQRQRMLGYRIA
jgi:hypothetical protein